MGNQRLTFLIMLGLYRDYTTPKRLKVTYSTTRYRCTLHPPRAQMSAFEALPPPRVQLAVPQGLRMRFWGFGV